MPATVYSAPFSYGEKDRFDVTRQSGGDLGLVFAPSWKILRPVLDTREKVGRVVREAEHDLGLLSLRPSERREVVARVEAEALVVLEAAWQSYEPRYRQEMRDAYRRRPSAFQRVLAAESVTFVCYCSDPDRCHRKVLREIFVTLGAEDGGEREPVRRAEPQLDLFKERS